MRIVLSALLLVATLGLGGVAAPAFAQEQPTAEQGDPTEERASEFRAVQGPVTEDVPGGALMISAYIVIWLLVFGYVFRLGRLSQKTRADVERLERSLSAGKGSADEG